MEKQLTNWLTTRDAYQRYSKKVTKAVAFDSFRRLMTNGAFYSEVEDGKRKVSEQALDAYCRTVENPLRDRIDKAIPDGVSVYLRISYDDESFDVKRGDWERCRELYDLFMEDSDEDGLGIGSTVIEGHSHNYSVVGMKFVSCICTMPLPEAQKMADKIEKEVFDELLDNSVRFGFLNQKGEGDEAVYTSTEFGRRMLAEK